MNTDIDPMSDDVIFLDARETFPIGDRTFNYVFSEHVIEHMSYNHGVHMLSESYRILSPGGRIRIATPNLEAIMSTLGSKMGEPQARYITWVWNNRPPVRPLSAIDADRPLTNRCKEVFAINAMFMSYGHRFIYNRDILRDTMRSVGFIDISQHDVGSSNEEAFQGLESHGRSLDNEDVNRFETMILEGKRPESADAVGA